MKAPGIIDSGRDIRITIENILKVWKKRSPQDVEHFFAHVADLRGSLNRGGISKGGTMLVFGEIPAKVHAVMGHVFGRHWVEDSQVFTQFCKVFSNFRVNETSRIDRGPDRPTISDGYHHEHGQIWSDVIEEIMHER